MTLPPATSTTATTTPATAPTATVQHLTVTPSTGLSPSATVTVKASGFSPDESLVVLECGANGTATTMEDCDLSDMQTVTSDASGDLTVRVTVTKGPFGADNIVCGASQACLVSVTQATPSPSQEADARITFS